MSTTKRRLCGSLLALLLGALYASVAGATEAGRRRDLGEHVRLDRRLQRLLARHDIEAPRDEDYLQASDELVELGNLLFYEKRLSGNDDVSCATCHHAFTGTSDGLSLPAGVGGRGLSTARRLGDGRERVPRNSPEIFNRGHVSFTSMFWDSRIEVDLDEPSGFVQPAGDELPPGLSHALQVQAFFPVTSDAEMRGDPGENEIADAGSNTEIWSRLTQRLLEIPEYQDRFLEAYPGLNLGEIGFEHVAMAIAAFESDTGRSNDSPFDRYLRGDRDALSADAKRGAILFYGRARCVSCHSGPFQTDLQHHAIAMPQIGPGKGHGPDGDEDFGRSVESGDPRDRYAFRTPPLRNVALTGPFGHSGAYRDLEGVLRHHLDPVASLHAWDRSQALLPFTEEDDDAFSVMDDPAKVQAIADANELAPMRLNDRQIDHLVEFLHALTDPRVLDLRADVPASLPSGLPLAD